MNLAFATKNLRTLCEDANLAIDELGPRDARVLQHRLADLSEAESIDELTRWVDFINIGNDTLRLTISDKYSLFIKPNYVIIPRVSSGAVDWPSVHRIIFVEEQPHE